MLQILQDTSTPYYLRLFICTDQRPHLHPVSWSTVFDLVTYTRVRRRYIPSMLRLPIADNCPSLRFRTFIFIVFPYFENALAFTSQMMFSRS